MKHIFFSLLLTAFIVTAGYAQAAQNGQKINNDRATMPKAGSSMHQPSSSASQGQIQEKSKTDTKGNQMNINKAKSTSTIQTKEQTQTKNKSEEKQLKNQIKVMVKTPEELKMMIKKKIKELNISLQKKNSQFKNVYKNQNKIRIAAYALMGMQNFVGKQNASKVIEIAKQLNASVKATIKAEEKIQKRSKIARFFMGGDKEAAQEIKRQLQQNQKRIQELKKIYNECEDCDAQVKELLKEQIKNIEQEQIRLGQVVKQEEKSKGIFGFLFGWLF